MKTTLVALTPALLLFLVGGAAHADDPQAARRHYEEGTKYYNIGDYARSAEEYKQAYLATPNAELLYDAAQAYRLAGDLNNALLFYRSFLRAAPNAGNRAEVEGRIKKAEADLAEQRRTAQKAPEAAQKAPEAAHKPPEAPAKRPEAAAAAAPPATAAAAAPVVTSPSAAAGATAPAAVDLRAAAAPPASAPAKSDRPAYKKPWVWVVTAVAVVGAGVGIGLGVGLTRSSAPASQFGTIKLY